MNYKSITKAAYDRYAQKYEEMFRAHFQAHVQPEADLFLRHLPGKHILDLGAGPGNQAKYFHD